jgi:hypothetical protein
MTIKMHSAFTFVLWRSPDQRYWRSMVINSFPTKYIMHTLSLYSPSKIWEKWVVSQKSHKRIIQYLCTYFNSVWWKCCMMFACQFDKNLIALLLFEGIFFNLFKNESISLQRATLRAGLQNRTPTTSWARSWHEMRRVGRGKMRGGGVVWIFLLPRL